MRASDGAPPNCNVCTQYIPEGPHAGVTTTVLAAGLPLQGD